jgi:peroxiredoxin
VVLAAGDAAPEFSLRDQHGQEQSLASRRGRRHVLLVFYPFAFTGVCSGEIAALAASAQPLEELDADVIAVSCDPVPSLRVFAEQQGVEFPLASDFWPHGAVAKAYGAFDESLGAAGRSTFVIDREGMIGWTTRSEIPNARDVADYLKALAEL